MTFIGNNAFIFFSMSRIVFPKCWKMGNVS